MTNTTVWAVDALEIAFDEDGFVDSYRREHYVSMKMNECAGNVAAINGKRTRGIRSNVQTPLQSHAYTQTPGYIDNWNNMSRNNLL